MKILALRLEAQQHRIRAVSNSRSGIGVRLTNYLWYLYKKILGQSFYMLYSDSLRPGDVILSTQKAKVSLFIRTFTWSRFSHAAIVRTSLRVLAFAAAGNDQFVAMIQPNRTGYHACGKHLWRQLFN